jgi:hypothetical protein
MKQYIDFFHKNRQKIDASCAPLLNSYRAQALETFERLGFPPHPSENYSHTDISRLLEPDFGFYLNY